MGIAKSKIDAMNRKKQQHICILYGHDVWLLTSIAIFDFMNEPTPFQKCMPQKDFQ